MTVDEPPVLSTLANGIRVLEALSGERVPLRRVASAVQLPRQTTYRLLSTLIQCGWVDRDETHAYGLTSRVWSFGVRSLGEFELRDELTRPMRDLADEYGESVHLAVYEHGEVAYIDKAEGSQPVRAYTALGSRAPAHCVATGKVLLSYADVAERRRVLSGPLAGYTLHSITDPRLLAAELDTTASRGYSVNRGEWRADVGGVAVPVRGVLGEVRAALGFSGPAARVLPRVDELVDALWRVVGHSLVETGT